MTKFKRMLPAALICLAIAAVVAQITWSKTTSPGAAAEGVPVPAEVDSEAGREVARVRRLWDLTKEYALDTGRCPLGLREVEAWAVVTRRAELEDFWSTRDGCEYVWEEDAVNAPYLHERLGAHGTRVGGFEGWVTVGTLRPGDPLFWGD